MAWFLQRGSVKLCRPLHTGLRLLSTMPKCKLVIFDKDGTLIQMENGWAEWTVKMSNTYAEALGKPIQTDLHKILGYDAARKRFKEGVMCDTNENIIKSLIKFLMSHGMDQKEALKFAEDNFFRYDASSHDTVPVDDPHFIMGKLKSQGVKTAVCTSDARAGNDQMMKALNLEDVCDYTLCGDDPGFEAKPDPHNIHLICDKLNVATSETVMIGDSTRDMQMGKRANVQSCIGVLTGVCDEDELRTIADDVIPSVQGILDKVL